MGVSAKQAQGEKKDFTALPAGTYEVEVEDTKVGISGSKNEKLDITFKVVGGNRKIFDNLTFVQAAAWKILNILEAIGDTKLVESENLEPKEVANAIYNKRMMVNVTVGEDKNGKDRNNVTGYAPTKHTPKPSPKRQAASVTPDDGDLPF